MTDTPEPLDPEEAVEMMNDSSDEEMVDLNDMQEDEE